MLLLHSALREIEFHLLKLQNNKLLQQSKNEHRNFIQS